MDDPVRFIRSIANGSLSLECGDWRITRDGCSQPLARALLDDIDLLLSETSDAGERVAQLEAELSSAKDAEVQARAGRRAAWEEAERYRAERDSLRHLLAETAVPALEIADELDRLAVANAIRAQMGSRRDA
ncbi:hypothetical protein [Magnetospirillum aberrantis]|uniref:Uncharacterized protein n=1 Tax=Magnetospirillum aberrantis SpK TaxID=908842 RepID=A0A7C9QTZ6_9PROT|nr:hypothetical protein [Magnetospirillum aberrantis]NFV80039.1 hypothetical protein [Magnetospirillum aberrantis SpK]